MKDLLPQFRGLNFWTLKQKIKDHTIQKTSTIQLLQKINTYQFTNPKDLRWLTLLGYQAPQNPNVRFHSDKHRQQKHVEKYAALKRSTGEMKSHSFVLQFQQFLEAMLAHPYNNYTDAFSCLDVNNTARTVPYNTSASQGIIYWVPAVEASATTSTYGILIGTGATAPTNTDYVIETQIAHGVGAGQLQYQATSMGAAAVVGANVDSVITRVFVNTSGGSITIREIGLVAYWRYDSGTSYFTFTRDAVNQAVANLEVAVVGYIIRTTV